MQEQIFLRYHHTAFICISWFTRLRLLLMRKEQQLAVPQVWTKLSCHRIVLEVFYNMILQYCFASSQFVCCTTNFSCIPQITLILQFNVNTDKVSSQFKFKICHWKSTLYLRFNKSPHTKCKGKKYSSLLCIQLAVKILWCTIPGCFLGILYKEGNRKWEEMPCVEVITLSPSLCPSLT